MARITTYDNLRGCYVIEPDNDQNHIQRLGELEDRDEAKEPIRDERGHTRCPICKGYNIQIRNAFCQDCGQHLKWGDDDSND